MPTFTALAFDRLIEAGGSKSMEIPSNADSKLERRNSTSNSRFDRRSNGPSSKLERKISEPYDTTNGTSAMTVDRKDHWTQISPALYAIPKSTPLPGSPSSFPPSPYIVNHKRRGPRLSKTLSEDDVGTRQPALDNTKNMDESVRDSEKKLSSAAVVDTSVSKESINSAKDDNFSFTAYSIVKEGEKNDVSDEKLLRPYLPNGSAGQNSTMTSVAFSTPIVGETDDFFDPQESMSVKSNSESENIGGFERSLTSLTPMAEFYDAWEELSSPSGPQIPNLDSETELREIRLSLLMEIDKRKQVEEALSNMQTQWHRIREQLSLVGLNFPPNVDGRVDDEQIDDQVEDLCQQVQLVRLVSNSIGRGIAKAEVETKMEAEIELKNFEIARLWDKLHYYEAVNREMSQRNQEAIETTRRLRQRRKRKQRWIWGSIATAITFGSAVLAWSYFSTGRESSSSNQCHSLEVDSASEHRVPKE